MPDPNKTESLENRLKSLETRLQQGEGKHNLKITKSDSKNYGNAYRMSSEFVAAILVGAAIGWAIDQLLNTTPWAMVIMLPLGFVAGVMNILRATGLTKQSQDVRGGVENNKKGFSESDKSGK